MRSRSTIRKPFAHASVVILVTVGGIGVLNGKDSVHLIAALDITKTEAVVGYSGKSEFEENKSAVSRLLAAVPPGSHVKAVAITDRTYTNPMVFLEARVSADPGYFDSRLRAARRGLVAEWNRQTKNLAPFAPHTDLLGLFHFAAEAFARSDARRKVLFIFSDMRNDIGLDLETPAAIDAGKALRYVEMRGLIARLNGVEIFIAGAGEHAGKKDMAYSVSLRQFWTEYLRRAGATLRLFSTGRSAVGLDEALSTRTGPRK